MKNILKKSLKLHEKLGGKLAVFSKAPLKTSSDLCLAYTPGVGEVCKVIAANSRNAKIYSIKKNTVAVITDGSAVLGLGNIGPLGALPVMEGKAILHKRFANIDAFPICLDTQDTEEIIKTIKIISPVFGAIHLEDISAPRCFEIENRLKKELNIPVLHDDQHSTAVVVLAALINAIKCLPATPYTLHPNRLRIVINGAGAAGIGIANLLLAFGFKNLIILDSKGTIYNGRAELDSEKKAIAKKTNLQKVKGSLKEALIGADVFIGVSKGGLLKPEMVRMMNKNSIVFAMANPVPEIMPELAKKAGAFIVGTGRSDFENQINNVLTFPGMFRGALNNNVKTITQKMMIQAAKNLAALVKNPNPKHLLPSLFDKRVVKMTAKAIKY